MTTRASGAGKSLRTFPDHAICRLQALPSHLRELVQAVAPEVAGGLLFEQARSLRGKLQLPDWRQVDPDLLFEIPFRLPGEESPMLVGVLLEHQSQPDPSMPFRALQYTTAYWEPQVRAWETSRKRGDQLRLKPVLLIVLHTGREPWDTNRSLAELIYASPVLVPYQPSCRLEIFDVPGRSPEDLLNLPGEWLPALTLVRVEREDEARFQGVFQQLLRRLEPMSAQDKARWQELVWFLLSCGLRRRPKKEETRLLAAAQESQENVALKEEVAKMGKLTEKTWEEEVVGELAQRDARAEAAAKAVVEAMTKAAAETAAKLAAEAEVRGELLARRNTLRALLEDRFGPLPPEWMQRIEAADNPDRLQAAAVQVLKIGKLDELSL